MVAQHSSLEGYLDDQVLVLRLHEEGRVHRTRCPAAVSVRSSVIMRDDDAEVVDALAPIAG